MQYQGTNIDFENSERTAAWCGETGSPCPETCANALQGNTLTERFYQNAALDLINTSVSVKIYDKRINGR